MATMPKQSFARVPITVSHDGGGHAHPDPATLKKSQGDEAEFFSSSTQDVDVIFDSSKGSPFLDQGPFRVNAGKSASSGPLKPDSNGPYPYRVKAATSTGPGADPTIIVS